MKSFFPFLIFLAISILLFIFVISCEHMRLNPETEDCDPTAFIDTTRIYFQYLSGGKDTLSFIPEVPHVAFDTIVTDNKMNSLFSEYELRGAIKFGLTNVKAFLMLVSDGKRAEEFFTFYGENTACGFGNQSTVNYATPVFWLLSEFPADSSILMLTDEFLAKIDTTMISLDQINRINEQHYVELLEPLSTFDWYLLRVTKQSDFNALDMANFYKEFGYAVAAAPNFFQLIFR